MTIDWVSRLTIAIALVVYAFVAIAGIARTPLHDTAAGSRRVSCLSAAPQSAPERDDDLPRRLTKD